MKPLTPDTMDPDFSFFRLLDVWARMRFVNRRVITTF